MATCNVFSSCCFSSFNKTNFSVVKSANTKTKTFRVACTDTSAAGPSLKECSSFSEEIWERKKEKVRHILLQHANNYGEKDSLILVDAIQRVGIDHLFYDEIDMILERQYYATNGRCSYNDQDLYNVSLYFRLLRQQGYYISADVFNNFKCSDGKLREQLKKDIRGLMELYEASQLSFKGENTIDEAEEFSRVNLNMCMENMDKKDWYNKAIKSTLRHPHHKNIARFNATDHLDVVGGYINGCKEWETFTDLAKMDIQMAKSLHQQEILQHSKWWKSLGLCEELKFARNEPVKWYACAMGVLINYPSLSFQRLEFTKAATLVNVIDDIFDVYGTLDELTMFTQAVNRWDYGAIYTLPEYMKSTYKALLDTTNEIAQNVENQHGYNPIHSFKEAWVNMFDAFLVEARWINSKELLTAEDYLKNAQVTSGAQLVLVHLFFLLGLGRDDHFNLNSTSNLMASVGNIIRLWNDLGSAKVERKETDDDGSYIKCYMQNEPNASKEEAEQHALDIISNEWKNLNEECFHLNHSSALCFKRACLNFARFVTLLHNYENLKLPIPH